MEYNPFCFESVQAGILELWALLLYPGMQKHKIAVNTMVTCSYKWPTYNVYVSSIKLT